jgi:phospholipase/carboxylesterase
MDGEPAPEFKDRLADLGAATLGALHGLEMAARHLGPGQLEGVREGLAPLRDRLGEACVAFGSASAPESLGEFQAALQDASGLALEGVAALVAPDPANPIASVLGAMSAHARAQEGLYPLRAVLPPLGRYFLEEPLRGLALELDPRPPEGITVGLHRAGGGGDRVKRGGFTLYVPERYDGSRDLPLVVALHGGMGHGADFLWTWLREARSREVLLLAPTSVGSTWSLNTPPLDAVALRSMVAFVGERWRVDPERILLTGLSDGATFTLLAGLAKDAPYTALAPVSGVLHPLNFGIGNLDRAAGRRIYLVHGAKDWMFPIAIAHAARDALQQAGADLEFREIGDLSHAYPREENARILRWLDPGLALPGESDTTGPEAG